MSRRRVWWPRWRRRRIFEGIRRSTRNPAPLNVRIIGNAGAFDAGMTKLRDAVLEVARIDAYNLRISREWHLARAQVGALLDQLCENFDLDPVWTWRVPREREARDRGDQAAWRVLSHYAATVTDSRARATIEEIS